MLSKQQYTLNQIAEALNAPLVGNGQVLVHGIAPLYRAKDGEISFCARTNQKKLLQTTQASVVLLRESEQNQCQTNLIIVRDPYVAYAKIAQWFDTTPVPATHIHPQAVIDANATLGVNVCVGAGTVIESDCVIEDDVHIGPNCFIGRGVSIGVGTKLWSGICLAHGVKVGRNCLIQSGAVIGGDGFGYANEDGKWIKIPQLGNVTVGDNVEIGANTTIDRGALDDTLIASQVVIDNLCHIAHNVSIGYGSALAGGVIVAGGTVIGKHCLIGGASVLNGHIEICDHVTITGMCMLMRSVTQPGVYSSGIPAQANRVWRKTAARVLHIEDLHKRLLAVEKCLSTESS